MGLSKGGSSDARGARGASSDYTPGTGQAATISGRGAVLAEDILLSTQLTLLHQASRGGYRTISLASSWGPEVMSSAERSQKPKAKSTSTPAAMAAGRSQNVFHWSMVSLRSD